MTLRLARTIMNYERTKMNHLLSRAQPGESTILTHI